MLTRDVLDDPETFHPNDAKQFKLHLGFAANFTDWFLLFLEYRFDDITAQVKNTEGNYENTNFQDHDLNAGSGVKTWGIVIGNGTTTPTYYDYAMESRLYALWDYSAVSLDFCEKDEDHDLTKLRLFRAFTNNSGNSVDITEIGIIMSFGSQSYQKTMIAHYVIDPVSVADGQTANVYWNFNTPIISFVPEEEPPE